MIQWVVLIYTVSFLHIFNRKILDSADIPQGSSGSVRLCAVQAEEKTVSFLCEAKRRKAVRGLDFSFNTKLNKLSSP